MAFAVLVMHRLHLTLAEANGRIYGALAWSEARCRRLRKATLPFLQAFPSAVRRLSSGLANEFPN